MLDWKPPEVQGAFHRVEVFHQNRVEEEWGEDKWEEEEEVVRPFVANARQFIDNLECFACGGKGHRKDVCPTMKDRVMARFAGTREVKESGGARSSSGE